MIQFITEGNSIFAVEQNVEKNGKLYDELWYSEITENNEVIWQDDWQNPDRFTTLHDAKSWVLMNYNKHTAVINGTVSDIE